MNDLLISTIQANLFWENKAANLCMFYSKIMALENTEIVALPEMFSTGFTMHPAEVAERMDGATVEWMRNTAIEKRVVLTGSLVIEENGQFFNRLIWMLPNGTFGYYNKRHLFAYAGENDCYTPGVSRLIASVKNWKINLQVCYDLRFPVWARQTAHKQPFGTAGTDLATPPEYDVIIYVANWPQRRSLAWKTLLMARAIENQCYVVGVNRVGNDNNNIYHGGDSMIIDPLGEILYNGKDAEESFTISLSKQHLASIRTKFPFANDADKFLLL